MEIVSEEWRDVDGYEGKIRVNRLGEVQRKNLQNGQWDLARSSVASNGYKFVCIPGARNLRENVHTLVARVFLGPRPEGLVIDHINADKTDNRIENLEYVTNDENMRRAAVLGRFKRGSDHYCSKLTEEGARLAVAMLRGGAEQSYVARRLGVGRKTISDIVCRKTWKHLNLNTKGLRRRNKELENAS